MSHHNHIHHVHQRAGHVVRDAQPDDDDPPVVVSIVFVTAAKTFDGPIGGYRTLNPPEIATPAAPDDGENMRSREAEPRATSVVDSDPRPTAMSSPSAKQKAKEEMDSTSEPISPTRSRATAGSSSRTSSRSSEAASTDAHSRASISHSVENTPSSTSVFTGQSRASSAAFSLPTADAVVKTQGMTAGAKAGVAMGVILCVGLLGLLLFLLKRMKDNKNSYLKADDEKAVVKNHGVDQRAQSFQSTRTNATAPRLSLRPVTQFLPDLGARRKSGNLLAIAGDASPNAPIVPQEQHSEKSTSPVQPISPADPFGLHAEVPLSPALPVHGNKPTNPFENNAETLEEPRHGSLSPPVQAPAPLRIRTPTPESTVVGSVSASTGVGAAREERYKVPNQLNVSPSRPHSPAGTEFSMSSVSTGQLAHGPPPSNVYRVQLDFNPSMDDELGLQAGQLVRLLHEYDDGWALCIRLDRSQQGVAPRTCLSARPVKPRPAGNNRVPPSRGPPPPGMFGPGQPRPLSPAGGRSSPSNHYREQVPVFPGARPGPRSMSPGPYGGGPQRPNIPPPGGKRRSNSASQVRDRRNSPPGPSPMNPNASNISRMPMPMQLQAGVAAGDATYPQRKPVPGQAI